MLLLLGLDFQNVLSLLLPLSIAINIFQIKDNIHLIDFILFKKLVCFTLPLIVLILYFIKINNIDINLYIGLFLILISLKNSITIIDVLLKKFLEYETFYLIALGVFHGFTNLGGALLSAMIFNTSLKNKIKEQLLHCAI